MRNDFYDSMEKSVVPFVRTLRNYGINTTASCHHDGYILAMSLDPTREHITISNVMLMLNVKEWTAVLTVECSNGAYHNMWEIKSVDFINKDIGD